MQYSGAGGKLIHQKNQKQKISWHCPFKLFPARKSLFSDIPAGDRKIVNLFYSVIYSYILALVDKSVIDASGLSNDYSGKMMDWNRE